VTASLTAWDAGTMTIRLDGTDQATNYLLVAENWVPGWEATVDGTPVPTLRANHAQLSVAIPSGAREVTLRYHTPGYGTGKLITWLSLLGAVGVIGMGIFQSRSENANG
jgi:uncharacterized membrane protein YfhO